MKSAQNIKIINIEIQANLYAKKLIYFKNSNFRFKFSVSFDPLHKNFNHFLL
jgi:hypothetical protein